MKFELQRCSDVLTDIKPETVEINTLQDLEKLQESYQPPEEYKDSIWDEPRLIVDFKNHSIIVYDFYNE